MERLEPPVSGRCHPVDQNTRGLSTCTMGGNSGVFKADVSLTCLKKWSKCKGLNSAGRAWSIGTIVEFRLENQPTEGSRANKYKKLSCAQQQKEQAERASLLAIHQTLGLNQWLQRDRNQAFNGIVKLNNNEQCRRHNKAGQNSRKARKAAWPD